jgi:IS30 family transposase
VGALEARAEREDALVAGFSIRTIAMLLGRAPSTVSREIKRNGGQGCYRASQADAIAEGTKELQMLCTGSILPALGHTGPGVR